MRPLQSAFIPRTEFIRTASLIRIKPHPAPPSPGVGSITDAHRIRRIFPPRTVTPRLSRKPLLFENHCSHNHKFQKSAQRPTPRLVSHPLFSPPATKFGKPKYEKKKSKRTRNDKIISKNLL